MYLDEIKIFTELIKSEICGSALPSDITEQITSENLIKIYRIAEKHDLTHVVAMALKKNQLFVGESIFKVFQQSLHYTVYRYEAKQYEYEQICHLFESEQIVYVPLKGAVIRNYYPEEWMRTSSDIDILVREKDLNRAKDLLVSRLNYTVLKHNYHDIAMLSPRKQIFELHFRILENEDSIDKMLGQVWNHVYPIEPGKYQYAMTPEYFVFHAVAHMLYHMKHGGCGVRFLIDIWLLENKTEYDKKILKRMYKLCDIEKFAKYIEKLSNVWFGEEKHDRITEQLELFVIEGGLFGTFETKVRARKTKSKGQYRYIWNRILQPYKELKASYPKLEKYPVLYPYYMIKRWCKIFNKEAASQIKTEIKLHASMKQDSIDALKELFELLRI